MRLHRKDTPLMDAPDVQPEFDLIDSPDGACHQATASLMQVLKTVAIPRLLARRAVLPIGVPVADPCAAELARLLVATDPAPAYALIDDRRRQDGAIVPLSASLFEPTARQLGDLWLTDDCTEVDVTLGLCRLQLAARRVSAGEVPAAVAIRPGRRVLVAPQPGELHLLTASLDAEVLWRAGWDIACEFPTSDDAVQGLVADTWFDALDLSLSAAFRREDWLPRMARTIMLARIASRNPALVVVVGGRIFFDRKDAGDRVGADRASSTALQAEWSILTARPAQSPAGPTH